MYLYHRVPPDLRGNILYPLNELRIIFPDLYPIKTAKYKGREELLERRIPSLDCLWNDVLFLAPVPPDKIKRALIESGRDSDLTMRCFKIDPHILDRTKTAVYLFKDSDVPDHIHPSNFAEFDPDTVTQYNCISEKTLEYFREMYSAGKNPLLYWRIPHILYKGTLDVSDIEIVIA